MFTSTLHSGPALVLLEDGIWFSEARLHSTLRPSYTPHRDWALVLSEVWLCSSVRPSFSLTEDWLHPHWGLARVLTEPSLLLTEVLFSLFQRIDLTTLSPSSGPHEARLHSTLGHGYNLSEFRLASH